MVIDLSLAGPGWEGVRLKWVLLFGKNRWSPSLPGCPSLNGDPPGTPELARLCPTQDGQPATRPCLKQLPHTAPPLGMLGGWGGQQAGREGAVLLSVGFHGPIS